MERRHQRTLCLAAVALAFVWLLSWTAYTLAKKSKMTADRVFAYQNALDLAKLSAEQRRKALQELVDKLNALSLDERRKWHFDRDWFRQLTDDEKSRFIDAFLPGEMKQALSLFEQMPKEQQQRSIDDALRELRENAANPGSHRLPAAGGAHAPLVSPELDKKIRTLGLNALYSQGSAQTKAELAPLLIEVQRQLERGQLGPNDY